jgi:hypothetical protein
VGCDIHGWVEVIDNGKWIAVKALKDRQRNYRRFALLAGVRDYQEESQARPKGIPDDISDTAKYDIKQWNSDGHSHSYIALKDAAKIFLATDDKPTDYAKEYALDKYFDFDGEKAENARLIFWFDN